MIQLQDERPHGEIAARLMRDQCPSIAAVASGRPEGARANFLLGGRAPEDSGHYPQTPRAIEAVTRQSNQSAQAAIPITGHNGDDGDEGQKGQLRTASRRLGCW